MSNNSSYSTRIKIKMNPTAIKPRYCKLNLPIVSIKAIDTKYPGKAMVLIIRFFNASLFSDLSNDIILVNVPPNNEFA